jgi:hypothetical protein
MSALYDTFKEGLLNKLYDLDTDIIKATLIDGDDYTFSAAHSDYNDTSDVPAAAKVAVSGTLSTPTITNGVFDTADFTWTSVTGDQSEEIILWDDTVTNDQLIANYDTGMTGMPVTPNGGDINVTVNGSGWFAL